MTSDDDFEGPDDDELVALSRSPAISSPTSPANGVLRASKRRRLNSPTSLEHDNDPTEPGQASRCASHDGYQERVRRRERDWAENPDDLQFNRQKYADRTFVPKHVDSQIDFLLVTQAPPCSQDAVFLRGPIWKKPPPHRMATDYDEQASKERQSQRQGQTRGYPHKNSQRNLPWSGKVGKPATTEGQLDLVAKTISQVANTETVVPGAVPPLEGDRADISLDALPSPLSDQKHQSQDDEEMALYDFSSWDDDTARQQRIRAPTNNLRQTTLFGTHADGTDGSQPVRKCKWSAKSREEPATHHEIDRAAMGSWVYPMNLGCVRDYQFNIVARGLYHNLLVALPTGLGKTFIAAAIMLNWFRWTKTAQIVFVAPTKPLVAQQVDACFNVAGIPRSQTVMLTGNTPPAVRAAEWAEKRVFFMTPQTIINDLKLGTCDPRRIVLVVVDEAHRATGSYAYVEVVNFLRRFNDSFRVLGLTATPGSTVEGVQGVIDGLGISRVEIRTEASLDIRSYVHPRKIDTMIFEYSAEMTMIMDLFSTALQPLVSKLCSMNAYWNRDPMALTAYGCTLARQKWMASAGRGANMGMKGMVSSIFGVLASLAHAIELLKFHGIGPFFHKLVAFKSEEGKSKYRQEIITDESFQKMICLIQQWIKRDDFIGHPKVEYLQSTVLNHFLDADKEHDPNISSMKTRVMIFVHYRDSAEEVCRVLKRHDPMVRPHVFVGQATSKGSEGMGQKTQLEIIKKFKEGVFNTLVATSIGEEGLDIGEVDLIVCYDASASPIRMLQRMGRTGRKRAGNIVVLLVKGKEEDNFTKAKDNYEKMQEMIATGTRFQFHKDLSPRIVPRDIRPEVDKRIVEIPTENTQADAMPEPKRTVRPPKRPKKKFNMPDGVRTGFTTAMALRGYGDEQGDSDFPDIRTVASSKRRRLHSLAPDSLPDLDSVFLNAKEEGELDRNYLDIGGTETQTVEAPALERFPKEQKSLRPIGVIGHSHVTKRLVMTLRMSHDQVLGSIQSHEHRLTSRDRKIIDEHWKGRERWLKNSLARCSALGKSRGSRAGNNAVSEKVVHGPSDTNDDADEDNGVEDSQSPGRDSDLADFVDGKIPNGPASVQKSSSKRQDMLSQDGEVDLPSLSQVMGAQKKRLDRDQDGAAEERGSMKHIGRKERRVIQDGDSDE